MLETRHESLSGFDVVFINIKKRFLPKGHRSTSKMSTDLSADNPWPHHNRICILRAALQLELCFVVSFPHE